MLSFREYLMESVKGNYVSIDVDRPLIIPSLAEKFPTAKICIDEQHATLMYSETTDIADETIKAFLSKYSKPFKINLGTVEAFDSPMDDGSKSELCAIVVKIESNLLSEIHSGLKKLGLKHSYADFQPHISVLYKLPMADKNAALSCVRDNIEKGAELMLKGYNIDAIDKSWASKIK
jgi:2'-5' RNA ligase